MESFKLNNSDKLYLSTEDIAKILSINNKSARVSAARYFKKGFLIRLKRDLYITKENFSNLTENEIYMLANILQVPSYISLTTALGYYNISTQQQQNFIESIGQKRTKEVSVQNLKFTFTLIKKELYEGFTLNDNIFIAMPEKALFDAVYLTSLGKYNCDFDSINFKKINVKSFESYLYKTNDKTKYLWDKLCKTYKI